MVQYYSEVMVPTHSFSAQTSIEVQPVEPGPVILNGEMENKGNLARGLDALMVPL